MARPKIYSINENYFNEIDTHAKAYIIGFLYADGNVSKNSTCIRCTISKDDVEILEFIKQEMLYTGSIKYTEVNSHRYCSLYFNSSSIRDDLIRLGIVPNKTYDSISLPKCPAHLFNSMMLGFFDGDGSIWKITNKTGNVTEYCVNFSNNEHVLLDIKQWLYCKGITSCKIRYRRGLGNKNACMLDVKGSVNIENFFKLLYQDVNFSLTRKKSLFLDFMEHCQQITRKYRLEQKEEIIKMYENCIPQYEIADMLKIPRSSVRGVIQRGRRDGIVTRVG